MNAVVFLSSPCASFVSGVYMIIDDAMTDGVNTEKRARLLF